MARENFKSRLGFILVSAGCAIGIGNVWRFPYVVGENGGGVFVLFYLLFLITIGIPVLTMELAVGRASRKSTVLAYKALEKPRHKWHWHGWIGLIGCTMLMMYYTTVAGWILGYFYKFVSGSFQFGMSKEATVAVFDTLKANPGEMILWTGIMILVGFLVCSFGVQKGLERISKWMMIALLALIVVLAVYACTLPGAGEGLSFYLLPDFERAAEVGIFNVATAAMNQAFFTLSLGIASMEIFGSYMSKDNTLGGEAARICVLDTFVAVFAGLIIFPSCFSFGVQPDTGPSLIFETLPSVFVNMSGGRLWGALFFLFMTFASFTTIIGVFENILAICIDTFGWSRRKAVIICGIGVLVLSMPALLGYNLLSDVTLIKGNNILNSEDFIVSNLLLPSGTLIYLLFCTSKWGWGFDKYLTEANEGKGLKLPRKLKSYFQFVLPILILIIMVQSIIG